MNIYIYIYIFLDGLQLCGGLGELFMWVLYI